jgi:hypothetical protein
MCEFAAKYPTSLVSPLLLWLFRGVSWSLPLLPLAQGELRDAVVFALVLGCFEGSTRARIHRTARSLEATARGLVIASAFATWRVPWAQALAIEARRRGGGVDHVAVHYLCARRLDDGIGWQQVDGIRDGCGWARRLMGLARSAWPEPWRDARRGGAVR